jgi:hypothetical protein
LAKLLIHANVIQNAAPFGRATSDNSGGAAAQRCKKFIETRNISPDDFKIIEELLQFPKNLITREFT